MLNKYFQKKVGMAMALATAGVSIEEGEIFFLNFGRKMDALSKKD